ncbi:hypothetical protein ACFV0R_24555 [Streptomyces sp. NPDC059578]|uniref:hypothetical protein n=1 Tax=unclassified Streptomyces TaxID=2593676 RepID=UPI003647DDDF
MSTIPDPARSGAALRSADDINEDIRALWARAGGRLSTEQRRQYQCLVMEWSAARQAARQSPPARDPRAVTGDIAVPGCGSHAA